MCDSRMDLLACDQHMNLLAETTMVLATANEEMVAWLPERNRIIARVVARKKSP